MNWPRLNDKPQCSLDGSRIGFATTRSVGPELRAVDPDTGAEEPLARDRIAAVRTRAYGSAVGDELSGFGSRSVAEALHSLA